jgi:hypothetical protein
MPRLAADHPAMGFVGIASLLVASVRYHVPSLLSCLRGSGLLHHAGWGDERTAGD